MSAINLTSAEFARRVADIKNNNDWKFLGDKPAIIDFFATWCAPCQRSLPIVHSAAEAFSDKVDIYTINVDNERELARYFGIRSIPTLVFIPQDGAPIVSPGERRSIADITEDIKEKLDIEL